MAEACVAFRLFINCCCFSSDTVRGDLQSTEYDSVALRVMFRCSMDLGGGLNLPNERKGLVKEWMDPVGQQLLTIVGQQLN